MKRVIWDVSDDHVFEEGVEHEELSLQVFILIYLVTRDGGVLGTI